MGTRHHPRWVPNLQTTRVQLGRIYTRRKVWKQEYLVHGNRRLQHGHRSDGDCHSSASHMALASAYWAESRVDRSICYWSFVSSPVLFSACTHLGKNGPLILRLLNSVSAISMIRVASLQNIIFDELSYTLATPLTWTFLEMDLAIIACNLPLLRPVANFLFPRSWMGSSRDKSDSRAYGTANGTANGAVNGSCKNRSQHVHMSGAENNLLDPNQNNFLGRIWSNYEEHGHSDVELANNAAPPDGIRVSTDLRVETSV